MILLFLLIFASQNGIASGELSLEGINGRLNQLETQVHDLQSEVKDGLFYFYHQNLFLTPKDHKTALKLHAKTHWKSLKVKNQELESIVEMKEIEESVLKISQ